MAGRLPHERANDAGHRFPTAPRAVVLLCEQFTADDVSALRHRVARQARTAGLTGDQLDDFVLAVHELVTNAVRHGGGRGRIDLRVDGDTVTCDVVDHGPGTDVSPSAPPTDSPGGRGLWLAQQLTAGLMLSHRPDGVTATVTVCVRPVGATAPLPRPGVAPQRTRPVSDRGA